MVMGTFPGFGVPRLGGAIGPAVGVSDLRGLANFGLRKCPLQLIPALACPRKCVVIVLS